jgi:hypothetical protein
MFDAAIKEIAKETAAAIWRMLSDYVRNIEPQYQLIYSEDEAAAFLKVSKRTLQRWRNERLIEYIHAPSGQDGESRIYLYKLTHLMEFATRFEHKVPGMDYYKPKKRIDAQEGVH